MKDKLNKYKNDLSDFQRLEQRVVSNELLLLLTAIWSLIK